MAAATQWEALGVSLQPSARATLDQNIAAARAALGEEVFAAAWDAGRALSVEAAVAEALGESGC